MPPMLKTTVYLTPDLKTRLERVAAERGQSEADVIRTALEDFVSGGRVRPRLPLFSIEPITDWEEALEGFGED